jgi:hypothetical protein
MLIGIVRLSLIAAMAVGAPAAAQVRADPGVVIGNRIAVRVNVTLADQDTPYYPVRNLMLAFTRPASDTVTARTDEAGVVTVLLTPGQYTVATVAPVSWKGEWYSWTLPVAVRADMPAIEFSGSNARRGTAGKQAGRAPATTAVQSAGEAASVPSSDARSGGAVRWLSIEAGGEAGVTKLGDGSGSDAGYGGAGSFVGGLGDVALAIGYRYTRIAYGNDLDPGSLRGGTVELRYHLRPGAAPIRPYLGAIAEFGEWRVSESLSSDEASTTRMFGGTLGAQFGLATSVRLHMSATAAGTNTRAPDGATSNGLFAALSLGLTFDIFSPAR